MTPHTTWRRAAGPATAATLAGIALTLITADRVAGGIAVFSAGCIGLTLLLIHDWLAEHTRHITDTTAERARLAAAEATARNKASQYEAAYAACTGLRERYAAHAADLEAASAQAVDDGIAAARQEFEDERTTLMIEQYRQGVLDERAGRITPQPQTPHADLIHLADHRRAHPGPVAENGVTRP